MGKWEESAQQLTFAVEKPLGGDADAGDSTAPRQDSKQRPVLPIKARHNEAHDDLIRDTSSPLGRPIVVCRMDVEGSDEDEKDRSTNSQCRRRPTGFPERLPPSSHGVTSACPEAEATDEVSDDHKPEAELPFGSSSKRQGRSPSSVRFDLSQSEEHSITPYAQIYDAHPQSFEFDRNGKLLAMDQDDVPQSRPERASRGSVYVEADPLHFHDPVTTPHFHSANAEAVLAAAGLAMAGTA